MRFRLGRILIPASVLFLVALVVALGRNLWLEQRALSTAGSENAQWTILQLDTEFANLRSVLLEESSRISPDTARIYVQTQIALSRIDLVSQGTAREIIESDNRASELLRELQQFADETERLTQRLPRDSRLADAYRLGLKGYLTKLGLVERPQN